jgi:prolipoprotein diacylglyceryltransferase
MYQGGGNLTHAWYGISYAGQVGKRVPVPIIQALEDAFVYVIALWVERRIARRGGPVGIVVTTAVTLYGAFRFNDEYVLLPHNTGGDIAVIVASVSFVAFGAALAGFLLWSDRGRDHTEITDPWRSPSPDADAGDGDEGADSPNGPGHPSEAIEPDPR